MNTYDPMLYEFVVAECDKAIDGRSGVSTADVHLITRQIIELTKTHCKHCNSKLIRLNTINGQTQYRRFCFDCGFKSNSIAHLKLTEDEKHFSLEDDGNYQNIYTDDSDRPVRINYPVVSLMKKIQARMKERGISFDYYEHLDSDKWRSEQRNKIFALDHGKCQICHKNKANQVHHLSYLNVGNESDDELMAVCRDCHTEITQRINYTKNVAESYKIVNEGKLYRAATRKNAHYEALKRRLLDIDLTPEDYSRRLTEMARVMEL